MATARDIMSTSLTTIEPSTTIADAARLMSKHDIGVLPVVEGGKPAGIITDRDIVIRAVAEDLDLAATPVSQVASTDLVTVAADDDADDVLARMSQSQVRRVLVLDGDALVGVISSQNIAQEASSRDVGETLENVTER